MVEGVPFNDDKPAYDLGREVMLEQARSANEIMSNNPPFSYNMEDEN
jgi:hypothetical protein